MIEFVDIVKSKIQDNNQKTYDLEVKNSHSYNINGIIVHNSVCITRLKAGVGRPQLSTIIECADAAHQLHAYVMSDGGCVNPCDINKAFCAGADFVMLGGMLAGCNEADGDSFEDLNGNKFKRYYGMSSKYAQEKHFATFQVKNMLQNFHHPITKDLY